MQADVCTPTPGPGETKERRAAAFSPEAPRALLQRGPGNRQGKQTLVFKDKSNALLGARGFPLGRGWEAGGLHGGADSTRRSHAGRVHSARVP